MPKCYFCDATLHFWEEIVVIGGHYFHEQVLTLNQTLRCKRMPSRILEAEEKRILAHK